jgi:hypothetical protein
MPPELDQIERWMQALIMHPDGISSGLLSEETRDILPSSAEGIERVVLPSKQLNSQERLGIYRDMYYWRLIGILEEEFPTVQQLFGEELFGEVARAYVTQHPSRHYSLTRLGSKFPGYLAEEVGDLPHRRFAAAVATVERAMEDVFDARQVEPIQFEDLQSIPIERWGDVRLQTIPALRLLRLDYQVNSFITAVRENRHVDIPASSPAFTAVYRHNYRVWRVDLDLERFTLLDALHQNESMGSALDQCASIPGINPTELTGSIGDWFREWTTQGLFCAAQLDT